ncbi:hypothetical protein QL285_039601 [Trifolium repens]|nr:hypothetical protein QL285_039601 [Trifolium repens]
MTTAYEGARRKNIEENSKRLKALNLPILSESLRKSSSSTSKSSSFVKGQTRFVRPGDLEVANKKRLRSFASSQAPPLSTTPPTQLTTLPTHPPQLTTPPASPTQVTTPPTPPTRVTTPPATNQEIEDDLEDAEYVPEYDADDELSRLQGHKMSWKKEMEESIIGQKCLQLVIKILKGHLSMKMLRKKMQDQLQAEIAKTQSETEAFVKVFGKEHGGFVRSMGLGVTPSQLTTSHPTTWTSSSEANEKMKKMQDEIDSLQEKASQVDILKEQVAFLMQKSRENRVIEESRDGRRSD